MTFAARAYAGWDTSTFTSHTACLTGERDTQGARNTSENVQGSFGSLFPGTGYLEGSSY